MNKLIDFLSRIQIGFDTAAFISIVGSAAFFYVEYRRNKKAERLSRFVEGARASVVDAVNIEVKEFALSKTRLQISTFRLHDALLTLKGQRELDYELGKNSYAAEYEAINGPNQSLSAKEINLYEEFFKAARSWNGELGFLVTTVTSSEKVLSTYIKALTSSNLSHRLNKATETFEAGQMERIVTEMDKDYQQSSEFLKLFDAVFSAYCYYKSQNKMAHEMCDRLLELATYQQVKDSFINDPSEDLVARYDQIDSAKELDDWRMAVLGEYCETVIENPWEYFSELADQYALFAEQEVPEKLKKLSAFQSQLLLSFLTE